MVGRRQCQRQLLVLSYSGSVGKILIKKMEARDKVLYNYFPQVCFQLWFC